MVGTESLNAGSHVVQFYGHDGELAEGVADYLLRALKDGGVAVVIATPGHRREFEARLTQAGVDLGAARERRAYFVRDARETLRELMAADRVEEGAFDRVVGGLIRRAGADGRRVHAYGEMVALLWDDGLVNAAVQLEERWNDLGRRHSFALFCSYRADAMTEAAEAFATVCRLHHEVIGTAGASAVRVFGCSPEAPAAARHFTAGLLREWGAGDLADDAALVVTELAANAVVHARSGFTVIVSARADRLRIAVRDASPPGAPLQPAPLHGLGAVDALAWRWGVEPLGDAGKSVWVELRLPPRGR